MAYTPTEWKDHIVEHPNRYRVVDNGDGTVDILDEHGAVIQQGTPVDATRLNKIEQGIKDAHDAIASHLNDKAPHPNIPIVKAYHSMAQSIPSSGSNWTTLSFDSEEFDTDDMHDNTTDNHRLTCKTAGKYLINAQVTFASNTSGVRSIQILKNGTSPPLARGDFYPSNYCGMNVSIVEDLNVGDFVSVQVIQNSGAALDVTSAYFSMVRVG